MAKKHAVRIAQVCLVEWDAVWVQEYMGVSLADLALKQYSGLPVLGLVLSDVAPLFLCVVWTHVAGRARRRRPAHSLHQSDAVAPVHALLDQGIPGAPLG